jgi:hypothetical protein
VNRPTAILLGSGVALSALSLWLFVLATDETINEPLIYASMAGMGIGSVMVLCVTTYLVRFPGHDRRDEP